MTKACLLFTVYCLLFTGFGSAETDEVSRGYFDKEKRNLFSLRNEKNGFCLVSENKEENKEIEIEPTPVEKKVEKNEIAHLPKKEPISFKSKKEIKEDLTILKSKISVLAKENRDLKRMFKQMEERFELGSKPASLEKEKVLKKTSPTYWEIYRLSKRKELVPSEESDHKLSFESTKEEVSFPNFLTSTKIPVIYSNSAEKSTLGIFGVISLFLNGLFFLGFVFSLNLYLKKRKLYQDEGDPLIYKSIIRTGVNELRNTYNQLMDEFEEKVREETLNINRKGRRLEDMIEEIDKRLKELDLITKSTLPSSKPKGRLIDVSSAKDSKPAYSAYNQIYRLSNEGLSIDEISKRTNMEKGKINLILGLNKRSR
ncbi:MAG: hypothetical protein QME40_00835 [bacterium]|nr:hypothetical protein [bacterium]